jgi:hypothetical protein
VPWFTSYFFWLKHISNQVILSELDEVCGQDVILLRAVEKWTAVFSGGRTEIINSPGSGGLVTLQWSMLSIR